MVNTNRRAVVKPEQALLDSKVGKEIQGGLAKVGRPN